MIGAILLGVLLGMLLTSAVLWLLLRMNWFTAISLTPPRPRKASLQKRLLANVITPAEQAPWRRVEASWKQAERDWERVGSDFERVLGKPPHR